jgi:hypothetical protein
MSNTARKARKRAGIQFTHKAKEGTPFFDRAAFKQLPAERQDAIADAHGHELTPAIKKVLDQLRPPRARRQVRNFSR